MLELAVLGSGSSGNSALVCLGETRILIDAGLSARQLCVRLEALGVDPDKLSGIVLTHEHGDHTRGIDVFCKKRNVPVYATKHTCSVVRESLRCEVSWHLFEAGREFRIDDVMIETFSVPHDAVDPVGFVFACGNSKVGVLSDVGHVTRVIVDRLAGVDTLFTEANYDDKMLQNDTLRPWAIKQRISNRHGHLSNEQTAELVSQIASPRLKRVVLGHLSSDCNCPDLAAEVIRKALQKDGFSDVDVECADRKTPLPLRSAARPVSHAEEKAAKSSRVCEPERAPTAAPQQQWQQGEWAF